MTDYVKSGEQMAAAIDGYLASRYPEIPLGTLANARVMNEHDGNLVRALYEWRVEAGWPDPTVTGESRCAFCAKVMGDELSVAEDEEICAKCGAESDTGTLVGGRGAPNE